MLRFSRQVLEILKHGNNTAFTDTLLKSSLYPVGTSCFEFVPIYPSSSPTSHSPDNLLIVTRSCCQTHPQNPLASSVENPSNPASPHVVSAAIPPPADDPLLNSLPFVAVSHTGRMAAKPPRYSRCGLTSRLERADHCL